VLILGVAYKKDIDDLRDSPVLDIIRLMEKNGANLKINEPHVPTFTLNGKEYKSEELTPELVEQADLVLITTDHSVYDYQMIADRAKVIFDTRNALKDVKEIRADYEKL
jgi:UDP-N-acetyl-D-glucosamine dehydrogenase